MQHAILWTKESHIQQEVCLQLTAFPQYQCFTANDTMRPAYPNAANSSKNNQKVVKPSRRRMKQLKCNDAKRAKCDNGEMCPRRYSKQAAFRMGTQYDTSGPQSFERKVLYCSNDNMYIAQNHFANCIRSTCSRQLDRQIHPVSWNVQRFLHRQH